GGVCTQDMNHLRPRAYQWRLKNPRLDIMQSDDLFGKKLRALNGNMGPLASSAQGAPAKPKMGVRARVSEWPPRKEGWSNYESLMVDFQNGQPDPSEDIGGHTRSDPAFLEPKYSFSEFLNHSPLKGLHPIRQRSNSDVTISDIDTEGPAASSAINPNTGASLRREYGSTSSIDRTGLTGNGFCSMFRSYPVDPLDHHGRATLGLPELLHYDNATPSVSPSLQTAAQIARGEIEHILGFELLDGNLLYGRERERSFTRRRLWPDGSEATSLFRKLRPVRSEHDVLRPSSEQEDGGRCRRPAGLRKCFAHYDAQSVLFSVGEAMANQANLTKRKNITTGASAASQYQVGSGSPAPCETLLGTREDLDSKENLDTDEGDGKSNNLVLSCPYFRNEIGGKGERRISLSRANSASYSSGESCSFESSLSSHCTNAGVSVLEVPRDSQPVHREKVKRYIIEHVDLGAYYYRKYFYGKEHQNYFGVDENLGPVAVSIRREKVDDGKEKDGVQYNYRVTFRTSELTTLRGAILEDAVPSTAKHGTARGLPLKEVLECVMPELNIQCLRLAVNSPKVPEQLLKLDEQGLSFQHKVGILYCKVGQSTEEEMYNNESAGPALEEFLDLLGQRVRLKGFTKYRAQLDNKTDSTGTHSLYTTYKDYELMFHVSTLLPYTPNNRQQLLRKRHIGNDIVTIVFQEPGALPFTPKNIRSHFQHVFVIVKVHNPCTENVCYSVAVSRSKDVPPFGPPIPKGVTFPKSAVFRDFLLAKVINGENAAHKSEKFRAMATRTRQEYLKDLAENFASAATVDSATKFSFITLGAKRKERAKPRQDAHLQSIGAITWPVVARDFGRSADADCLLGISNEFVVLVEEESKDVVFNCSCRDVIGWTSGTAGIKMFYERGECIVFSTQDSYEEDVRDIIQRLEIVTRGCETTEMTLRRNGLGQLGFHVNFEGIVADVEPFGFAWQAGLRQGSRLVEICKVAVATLTHEQMIDLLRTSVTVRVVIIPPYEDGTPRRGCSELYRIPMVEYKLDSEGTPCEYKTPFRRNTTWHRMPPAGGQALSRGSPTQVPDRLQCQPLLQQAIPRSTSFDRKLQDGHYRSSPSNQSSSSDPGPCGSATWAQQSGYERPAHCVSHCWFLSVLPETKWHLPATKILNAFKERGLQKEMGKESPNKPSRTGDKGCPSHCSSHSSSNTLSSSASSNSDDKHFGSGDLMDPELLGLTYIKGASTDSGIDTAPCMPPAPPPPCVAGARLTLPGHSEQLLQWTAGASEDGGTEEEQAKLYLVQGYVPTIGGNRVTEGSIGDLSEISSHSSGSHHSGSPAARSSKISTSLESSKVYIVSQGAMLPGSSSDARAYARQAPPSRYLIGWKKAEESPPPEEAERLIECGQLYSPDVSCQMESTETDRFPKSLCKEEFLKMILPDSLSEEESRRKLSTSSSLSPRRSLYRTLSDESICGQRRASSCASSRGSALDQALPNDILFSSTPPFCSTLPPPRTTLGHSSNLRNEFWFSDGSLAERSKFADPGLMPLPDPASGLDWSHLVDAARAFEEGSLTGKVNQLEVILRQLQYDLRKEKEDKALLQVQVQHLRQDNLRLHEESQTAAAQLRKFTEWFFHSVDKKP
uniref:Signal-induced proliferation-associated 1 like 2 n=1 Tax=Scleropages formosus TaxID=113540 RepID=A0A8C9V9U2_SCLFO